MRVFKLDQDFKAEFFELLSHDFGRKLVLALGDIVPYDKDSSLASALLALYNTKIPGKNIMDIISIFIARELESSHTINTLFRDNSMSSLLITTIFKQCGHSYLRGCLAKYVKKICHLKESLEADPHRSKPGSDVSRSVMILQSHTEKILASIYKSIESCPFIIRYICMTLEKEIRNKYPQEDTFTVVTGFLFLRFFCPAIFDPNYWGLVKTIPTKEGRRALVLVSKTIQVLANNASFGEAHDSHLIGMNVFLESHRKPLQQFINELSADIDATSEDFELELSFNHPLSTLVLYLQKHFIEIEDRFSAVSDDQVSFEKLRALLSRVEIFDENEFLEEKIKPVQEPKRLKLRRVLSSTFSELNFSSYEDFKDRDVIRDDSFKPKRRSSANEVEDTVINPVFGMPGISAESRMITRSDGACGSPRESYNNETNLSKSDIVNAEHKRKGNKGNSRFRRLGRNRSKKNLSHTSGDDISRPSMTLEEENEVLRSKIDSLKLQVQMLGDRNADLRHQNQMLLCRNEELEGRRPKVKRVTRQASTPESLNSSS